MRENGCMAADGHLVAVPDDSRALIYFSHPMAAFGQKRKLKTGLLSAKSRRSDASRKLGAILFYCTGALTY